MEESDVFKINDDDDDCYYVHFSMQAWFEPVLELSNMRWGDDDQVILSVGVHVLTKIVGLEC